MPSTAFMTDEELLNLPKNGYKYEYINGELVKTPGTMLRGNIGLRLGHLIDKYLDQNSIAEVYGSNTGYRMRSDDLLSPDLSVVLIKSFPEGIEPEGFGSFAPDIAVEVLSPSERRKKLVEKIAAYFANGSKLVFVLDPNLKTVEVYRSPEKMETLQESGVLDCSLVLPGFACKVSEIFKQRSR